MEGMNMGTTEALNLSNTTMSSGYKMIMYFHTQLTDYVLFESWLVLQVGQMVGACIGTFILGALYEGFKTLRSAVTLHFVNQTRLGESSRILSNGDSFVARRQQMTCCEALFSTSHLAQTACHFIQVTLGYLLMLIVMTFSVWLFIAAMLGIAFGYFIFGWIFPQCSSRASNQDHCM